MVGSAVALPAFAACDFEWRIAMRGGDAMPRSLEIEMRFDGGARSETTLVMARPWAGVDDFAKQLHGWSANVRPAEAPYAWKVRHAAGERVVVRYRVESELADADAVAPWPHDAYYRPQVGAGWFQFFGYALLGLPEEGEAGAYDTCLEIDGLDDGAPIVTSFGRGQGPRWRVEQRIDPNEFVRSFYAGGRGWRVSTLPVEGGEVTLALRTPSTQQDAPIAQAVTTLLTTQRRFWRDATSAPQQIVVTPNHTRADTGGTVVRRTAVLQVSGDFGPDHPTFESLIAHENLHHWIPLRFGSMAGEGTGQAERYWFSEGFTDHYTHRLLVASGLWSPQRYADEMTRRARDYLRSPARNAPNREVAEHFFAKQRWGEQAYLRGEFLALRWDRALRDRGHAGLDAVMHALLLPEPVAPGGTPEAPDRVVEALARELGALPRRDVERYIGEGATLTFEPDLLGPCFDQITERVPSWVLGFDRASFDTGRVTGVRAEGPAHAAGLREGMELIGGSYRSDDIRQPVELTVKDGVERRVIRYLPAGAPVHALPRWRVRPDASRSAACSAWMQPPARGRERHDAAASRHEACQFPEAAHGASKACVEAPRPIRLSGRHVPTESGSPRR